MNYYKVGTIVNTQGLQGEVRVISVTDFAEERYQKHAELALFDTQDQFVRVLKVKTHRKQKQFDIVKFDGLYSINDVEQFRDYTLKIAAENRSELESEDEFYYDDIIGLTVFEGERLIGTISEILQPGANDVWVVKRKGKKELLLPFIDSVILSVDLVGQKVIVDVPEGLDDADAD
ncbi:MAG: ribosome maturation factor RimM [Streptococcaceae bacterium]|nr:ribosome maturation factor RimM [Streptococcaceae bacterium]